MNNGFQKVKHSLTKKMTLGFVSICVFIGIALGCTSYNYTEQYIATELKEHGKECAINVSNMLHGAPFDDYLAGKNLDLYNIQLKAIRNIANTYNLKYLYVYIPDLKNNKLIAIFGVEGSTGKVIEYFNLGESNPKLKPLKGVVDIYNHPGKIYYHEEENDYGHVLTAYATITDNNNKPIGIVGADISYDLYESTLKKDRTRSYTVIFISLTLIYLFLILYVRRTFIKPIYALSTKMKNFVTNGQFKYTPIRLNTNDEFNIIAESYNIMAQNIQKSMKEIFNAQMETIFSLAKLVQTRDDSTGKHIERVQAYCRIMAIAVMKAKLYPDIVDKTFIKNLVSASPLHDIGKVAITDMVLQNEKRLTPEEIQKMQKHTVYGERTLAKINSRFGHNDFIKIGMSIARSHHEKWNGTGYPDGLKGEEIPLAARIAAIADVYDALATRRVYKPAFPHSKCVQIIVGDRGTHFDPQLIDLFIKIEHKFLKIRHSFEAQEISNYFEEKEEI